MIAPMRDLPAMGTPWRWLIILLLVTWCAGCTDTGQPAPVQEGLLTYGDTVTQAFTENGQAHRWSFVGQAGDTIDMIMLPAQGTPGIVLVAPDGTTIETINSGSYQNIALIHARVLPAAGAYEILVIPDANGPGSYTLTLNLLPPATPTFGPVVAATATQAAVLDQPSPIAGASPTPVYLIDTPIPTAAPSIQLTPYHAVEGWLALPEQADRYTFFGRAGQTVTVGMTSPPDSPVDPYLAIYAPAGDVVAEIDDAFGTNDAILTDIYLPATGAYIVFARDAASRSTGAYTISYGRGHTMRDVFQAQAAPETVYTGTISQIATRDMWTMDLQLGDVISIAVVVADDSPLDPEISLITPEGLTFFRDDNSGGGRSAALRQIIIPQDGHYQLAISPTSLAALGTYTLIWRYDIQVSTATP